MPQNRINPTDFYVTCIFLLTKLLYIEIIDKKEGKLLRRAQK